MELPTGSRSDRPERFVVASYHQNLISAVMTNREKFDLEVVYPDADIESADWPKQTWDLPAYKSREFLNLFPDLEAFRLLPVYSHAVTSGLIVDDQWVIKLGTQQIGKLGELLVQYQLLQRGIETAHLTTDAGIDLVAYSSTRRAAKTIQVKTNLRAKPAGGKGARALDWWFPTDSVADLIALVDISENRVWLFTLEQAITHAQQSSSGGAHLYMYIDPLAKVKNENISHADKFDEFLLRNCLDMLFI